MQALPSTCPSAEVLRNSSVGLVIASGLEEGGSPIAASASTASTTEATLAAGEGPTFLENFFGDCLSYPNVVWAQEVVALVHETSGLPWWLSIAATTWTVRGLLFPLAVYQQKIAGHLQAAAPKLQAAEEEHRLAKTIYKDPGADARRKRKMDAIYAEHHNCRPWKLFANMGMQVCDSGSRIFLAVYPLTISSSNFKTF